MSRGRYSQLPTQPPRKARRRIPRPKRLALQTVRRTIIVLTEIAAALVGLVLLAGIGLGVWAVEDPVGFLSSFIDLIINAWDVLLWILAIAAAMLILAGIIWLISLPVRGIWELWRSRRPRAMNWDSLADELGREGRGDGWTQRQILDEWCARHDLAPEDGRADLAPPLARHRAIGTGYRDPDLGIRVQQYEWLPRSPEDNLRPDAAQDLAPGLMLIRITAPMPIPLDGLILRSLAAGGDLDDGEHIPIENRELAALIDLSLATGYRIETGFLILPPTLQEQFAAHFATYEAVALDRIVVRDGWISTVIPGDLNGNLGEAGIAVEIIRDMLRAWSVTGAEDAP